MSAIDTVKDIAKIAVTSGLSSEIIGLLEKKIELLTEQVTTLDAESKNLKAKVYDLEQELSKTRPKENGLDETSVKFLQLLAQRAGLRIEEIASALNLLRVKAEYHRDVLKGAKMIGYHGFIVDLGNEGYELLAKGREYLASKGLI